MSDEAKPAESPEDALLGLTSLDFGPSWARGGDDKKSGAEGKGKRRRDDHGEDRGERRGERRRDGRRGDGRGDNRGGNDRRDGRRDDRRDGPGGGQGRGGGGGGRRFDNRDGGDRRGGGKRFDKGGGRGRHDDDRRPPRQETPAPEGFTADVMPVEDGLDGLAKEILAGGRTYSVFDLAKLVLGARERFNVTFRSKEENTLYRCKKDSSLWLSKEEALRHFWRSDWRKEFYQDVVADAKPPAGNFQTVARCGISGEWLGPPNYHGYQPALTLLHRERFGHMSLENYKRKIRMERGEEAVAAWLEKMSKRVRYRPTGGALPEEPAAEETPGEDSPEETGAPEEAAADAPAEDASAEAESDPAAETPAAEPSPEGDAEEAAPGEAPPAAEDEVLLDDLRDVERHFIEHYFEDAFVVTNRAWVSGNIPGNNLSPGLLTLLRETVSEERRYPGRLTPMLCRQLSGRHVAVFKWKKKLKAGPSRPHPVPSDIVIADRPKTLLSWVAHNSGKKIERLWKDVLPNEVSDQEKLGWYHDLHWLLNQGYVLLMADSTLFLSKPVEGLVLDAPIKKAPPAEKKPSEPKAEKSAPPAPEPKAEKATPAAPEPEPEKATPAAPEQPAEAPPAPAPNKEDEAPPEATGETTEFIVLTTESSGLYALSGRTLSGLPKSPESLTGRGLWPQSNRRLQELDEEGEDEESDEDRQD